MKAKVVPISPLNGHLDEAKEVLSFLNEKLGKKPGRGFRPVETNIKFIVARLESGIEVQDLKCIIAMKIRQNEEGTFSKMYLRPATLFNKEKCEQYFGELE